MSEIRKITLQQIIDAAWQRFIVEDAPPAFDGWWCSYRTDDGRACAVGLCLPDGHPATKSGDSFDGLVRDYPELFDASVIDDDPELLVQFQERLHDGLAKEGKWKTSRDERANEYRKTAKAYGLTLPNGGVL